MKEVHIMNFLKKLFNHSNPPAAEPFTLEFHFQNRKETDINEINEALSKHMLSNLELVTHEGYLATETTTNEVTNEKSIRYWYGMDHCVLECTPEKADERFCYQLDAMVLSKSVKDCAECWRAAHPGRIMRTLMVMEYANVYVAIVLHHAAR